MDFQKDTKSNTDYPNGHTASPLDNKVAMKEDLFGTLFKRTEKLVTALYMVTDYLEDNEPLKNRLRTVSIELIKDIHSTQGERAFSKTIAFETLKIKIEEMKTYLQIAGTVGLISAMNSAILIKEFSGLTESIIEREELNKRSDFQNPSFQRGSLDAVLPQSYFDSPSALSPEVKNSFLPATQSQGIYKGHTVSDNVLYKKDTMQSKGRTSSQSSGKPERHSHQSDIALKINRRNNILRLIKDFSNQTGQPGVTIKDISIVVSDCSEKTIQRELTSLVFEGVLKKIGKKRWSRYMLA